MLIDIAISIIENKFHNFLRDLEKEKPLLRFEKMSKNFNSRGVKIIPLIMTYTVS